MRLGLNCISKGMVTCCKFVPATGFAMANYVSYGPIDSGSPLSDFSKLSQDTVEDLSLYEDLLSAAPDASLGNVNLSSSKVHSVDTSLSAEKSSPSESKARILELERDKALQAGRISALEQENRLIKCTLTDVEECFNVLGQRMPKRNNELRDKRDTEREGRDDRTRENVERMRFLQPGSRVQFGITQSFLLITMQVLHFATPLARNGTRAWYAPGLQ
ncbi:uncharacterized protein M421DRAFT_89006 [Didymella exigua CBS 183.55]|uniref:Uncharacterized protein n=1 Tax=Didymella exigua CBS 183.55 TaxID=1150837 RepID=A0A6A5RXQ8_9PLEO|nr:uncharacterized protein M421DRAFT_89006 [Didymella exigua CBS 183.55]KAF1932632.1 hypothetical protein M421DRAFT_89006 [Didymella exigua CBS 183.55]